MSFIQSKFITSHVRWGECTVLSRGLTWTLYENGMTLFDVSLELTLQILAL